MEDNELEYLILFVLLSNAAAAFIRATTKDIFDFYLFL